MRPIRVLSFMFLPLVLLASGCVSENKGKLEGTRWSSEAGQVRSNNSAVMGPREVTLPAGYMELDFQKDGTLFYIINNKLHRGKYTLGMGSVVRFDLEEPIAGMKTHSEKITVDGRKMTMTDTDGTQLTFRKVN